MIFKFRLLSGENDDFVRDFEISSEQTFYDLHLAIQKNCHYDTSQIASFFLCNNDWEKENEIILFELSDKPGKSTLVMDNSILSRHITGLKQKLLYIFDIFNERAFFIEVVAIREVVSSKSYPLCTLSVGSSPAQILLDEIFPGRETKEQMGDPGTDYLNDADTDENFPGDDEPIEE
jgi:hypothetical protein